MHNLAEIGSGGLAEGRTLELPGKVPLSQDEPIDRSVIIQIMRKFRSEMATELSTKTEDPDVCNIYFEENRYNDKPYNMPLITLKTNPCSWLIHGGGCTTCGYNLVAAFNQKITSKNILNQVDWALEQIRPDEYPFITLSSAGSFMDSKEVDDDTRIIIMERLSDEGFEHFNFESRPEYLIDVERLKKVREAFSGSMSVGIGLESSDDFIRNYCLNKGFKTETFLRAIDSLKEADISYDTYVMFGKPFLSEKENIEDAVNTINFAFEHGADWAILMVSNIQPYTLTHWLWERGSYELPSLWSVFEVLEQIPKENRRRVLIKGVSRALPTPLKFSTTCNSCSDIVEKALIEWNCSGNFEVINKAKTICDCFNKLPEPNIKVNLLHRIVTSYSLIASNLLLNSKL